MRSSRRPVVILLLAACGLSAWWLVGRAGGPTSAALPAGVVRAAAGDRIILEPDDGMAPIYALLRGAVHTLDLSVYELADPTAEAALADDARRGVAVRVILDHRLEASQNAGAADYLRSHGVAVTWASDRFFVSHEKAFVLDRRTAVVMTLNLASRYYATTRDVAVVDEDPADVAAVEQVFQADFADRAVTAPSGDDLVWSPDRSRPDVLALIDRARRSILLESEELAAPAVIRALVDAAQRGVAVAIVMTDRQDWHAAFEAVTRAGARVSLLHGESPLYIHAKLLVTDAGTPAGRALVGSQNLSDTSLDSDRELGVVLTAPRLVNTVGRVVEQDMARGTLFR